jgi:putative hydrolase of the HAD superfamily
MDSLNIDLLLFDFGGVLVELSDAPFPAELLHPGAEHRLNRWFSSPVIAKFETGQITPGQLVADFKAEVGSDAGDDLLLEHFRRWPVGLYPGVLELLDVLANHYRLAALSNSNELHWSRLQHEFNLLERFEQAFSSHLIYKAKPDKQAFLHVIDQLDVVPGNVLFFDDSQINVDAANTLGMVAVKVDGFVELKAYLEKADLLPKG